MHLDWTLTQLPLKALPFNLISVWESERTLSSVLKDKCLFLLTAIFYFFCIGSKSFLSGSTKGYDTLVDMLQTCLGLPYFYGKVDKWIVSWTLKVSYTHTKSWPVSARPAEAGGDEMGNICSFSLASGTGLTMNLLPAEWTTCAVALGGMSGRDECRYKMRLENANYCFINKKQRFLDAKIWKITCP